mmetsp:Transcript_69921/g.221520  ORF Transcript_69921/g.221520 Transcript_69921/m.221520 type:complete len:259 (-) Transcript_69921:840-1616(-)
MLLDVLRAHADDDGDAPGHVVRVEHLAQGHEVLRGHLVRHLDPEGVAHALEELDVGLVQLARALAAPDHVGGAVVPQPGGGVLAGQRLLVVEEEALMGGVELGGLHEGVVGADAARLHEAQGLVDLLGHRLELGALLRVLHEVQVPVGNTLEGGVAARGEAADEVEGGGGLVVRAHQAGRVGHAGLGRPLRPIDDVAAVRGKLLVALDLRVRGAGLGKLPSHAADLHDGHAAAVHDHGGHLEEHAVGVADVVGREVIE